MKALRRQAEAVGQAEVEKSPRRLDTLSPAQQRAVEALSQSPVN